MGIDMKLVEEWTSDPSFINWANQSDDQDMAIWEAYFNTHPEKWQLAKIAKEIVLGISFKPITSDRSKAEQSLVTLLSKIEKKEAIVSKPMKIGKVQKNLFKLRNRWIVAASVTLFLFVGGFSYLEYFKNSEIYISTGYGEQKEIELPEGSFVTLNANSSLRYKRDTPRDIALIGEAFFEITKIPETNEQFKVATQDMVITVLGTSFNVNARNDQTKVFLEEGVVEIDVDDKEEELIKMNPGDVVTYSKKEKKMKEIRKNVSILENASWKEGALIFNKKRLIDALYDIEDIYGIQFVIESENLRKEEITGGVPIKDLKVTLETLHDIYNIQFRSEGQRYFISRKVE